MNKLKSIASIIKAIGPLGRLVTRYRNYRANKARGRMGVRSGLRVSRMGGPPPANTYKRSIAGTLNIASGSSAPYLQAQAFSFDQLPNYSDFTNLYDEYMITGIKYTYFQPYQNGTALMDQSTSGAFNTLPVLRLFNAVDLNDVVTPTLTSIQEYANCKQVELTAPSLKGGKISRSWVPSVNQDVDIAGTTYPAGNKQFQWLNTDYTAVTHYGLKHAIVPYFANGVSATFPAQISVPYRITITFKCRLVK